MGARAAVLSVNMDEASALGRKEVRKGGTGPPGTCHQNLGQSYLLKQVRSFQQLQVPAHFACAGRRKCARFDGAW